ncbi:MAG: hypothetical protein ACM3TR_09905 [Caulobacteraceae bacterium]
MAEKTVWGKLCEYCTAKAKEVGLTEEDSRRILEQVRKASDKDAKRKENTRRKKRTSQGCYDD